ncbi:MAG: metallophosphoesterase family protein [Candidatus Marinimicrobia bacterium]|nr:metallophosphoesterase family protein [Candidatus Neomarinimicrobiota bacterium]
MRIGLISDIHSNLEALSAVLSRLESMSVDRVICLGDIVGYGANPVECINMVREKCDVVLAGNHDFAVAGTQSVSWFNQDALDSVIWTKNIIDDDMSHYLSSLPLTHVEKDVVYVHGTPHKPEKWSYIVSMEDALYEFRYFKGSLAFVGHSHIAGIYCHDGSSCETEINLERTKRYIINVGSIGQPRDGNSDAAFAVYDDDSKKVNIEREPYDMESAAQKIYDASLPDYLASRLSKGI